MSTTQNLTRVHYGETMFIFLFLVGLFTVMLFSQGGRAFIGGLFQLIFGAAIIIIGLIAVGAGVVYILAAILGS